MANGIEVPLLSRDETTRASVAAAMEREPLGARTAFAESAEGLASLLSRGATPLAFVDLDPDPAAALSQVERLARAHPATRFVLLCKTLDTQLVLNAMQAGARHCIEKKRLAEELVPVAQRFLEESLNHGRHRGRIVTVLSASGGSGATSLAINLAVEAGERIAQPVLLVDLDLAYGSIATLLGLSSRYGVADVLSKSGTVDPELVRSTATVYSDRLHALVSPVSCDFSVPPPLDFANVEAALTAMRKAFELTVIDAPRVSMDVAATLARASDPTLLVFQQDVVDVRTTSSMLAALGERGVPRDGLIAVANRFHKRGTMLGLEEMRKALGAIEVFAVRNDYESALRSIDYGQPLAKVAARSVIRKDLGELLRRTGLGELAPARQP